MPRRRRPPGTLEGPYRAFAECVRVLEVAKAELLRAIPAARVPAVPLAEALLAFREGLEIGGEAMSGWRIPELESEWVRCREGLDAAAAGEAALRLSAGDLPHDVLLSRLGDLIAPLDRFEDAAHRMRILVRAR